MSTKLKLNVKNVILGCHNFGEILARHDTSMKSGFSRLVKPCPYFKQDHVRTHTRNHAEAVRPRSLDNESLKPITSEMPLISNRFDEVRSIDRISIAAYGLPWESPIRFYYDREPLKCPPPPAKEVKDCVVPPPPPCPPVVTSPKCPTKPKCYPCKKQNPCAKITPCTLKAFPLHNCRFFSGSPCQPIFPSSRSKSKFCKPKREIRKPKPKCRSPVHCGTTICNVTAAKDPCKPQFGAGGGGGGAGAGAGGGGGKECAGAKEAPKECYKKCTPGNTPGSEASKKGGPVCPPK